MNEPSAVRVPEDDQLVRYLLGELPAPEESAIDDALADEASWNAMWEAMARAEDELLDAYATDRLDPARRQRLAERIAASPRLRERVAVHQDLRTVARARRRRPRTRMIAVVGAAVVAVALVLVVVLNANPDGGAPRAPVVAMLTLMPTTRGDAMPAVKMTGHDALDLLVALDAEETYPRYRVRLTGPGATWSKDSVTTTAGALKLRIPVAALADGVHALELTGIDAQGKSFRLGARSFRVAP